MSQIQDQLKNERHTDFPRSELLRVLRLQLQSFDRPEKRGWIRALAFAQHHWGRDQGSVVFAEVAVVMDRIMTARSSALSYGNPDCACCASKLSPHEKLLVQVIQACWNANPSGADAFATLLCETNPHEQLVKSSMRLVNACKQSG